MRCCFWWRRSLGRWWCFWSRRRLGRRRCLRRGRGPWRCHWFFSNVFSDPDFKFADACEDSVFVTAGTAGSSSPANHTMNHIFPFALLANKWTS